MDKLNTGWLAWGKAYRAYAIPEEKSFNWDPASSEALDIIRERVVSKTFWEAFFRHLSQEHTRDYLAWVILQSHTPTIPAKRFPHRLDNVTDRKSVV